MFSCICVLGSEPSMASALIAPFPSHLTARAVRQCNFKTSERSRLTELVGPILHQRRRTDYDGFFDRRFVRYRALFEEGPQ
jgi:hypothetical protein